MKQALTCVFALLPMMAQAQMETTNPFVDTIIEAALQECITDVRGNDPTAPMPQLEIRPGAMTWVDLDGEGEKDDMVVDFNHILCSLNYSLWHGTGGSIIHLVVNGERSASLSGGTWRITEWYDRPVFMLGRHGSACDGYGAQPCIQVISVFEGGFSTVRFPEMDEVDARP